MYADGRQVIGPSRPVASRGFPPTTRDTLRRPSSPDWVVGWAAAAQGADQVPPSFPPIHPRLDAPDPVKASCSACFVTSRSFSVTSTDMRVATR